MTALYTKMRNALSTGKNPCDFSAAVPGFFAAFRMTA
jgi:hypothetical protein